MPSKTLNKDKSEQKTHIKLPYLERGEKPKPSPKELDMRLNKDFDLRTSNAKLPIYNPESDHNLKLFFGKPLNKKILEKLKN